MTKKIRNISVIIPAHNAENYLRECLNTILAQVDDPSDILVVDDGSTDATGDVARAVGVRVVRNKTAQRPARARNIGVDQIASDIVVFVDADVVIKSNAIETLLKHFEDPAVKAAFGSYDDDPRGLTILSKYRNLLHYFTHQHADKEAETFWSGLGAVCRREFLAVGGFDPNWENIEDVEFGLRLRRTGARILLEPLAQGTHLKEWSLGSMFQTDLWGRAVPWTRLIIQGRMRPDILNGGTRHRLSAACVATSLGSIAFALIWPKALWVAVAFIVLFVCINRMFFIALFKIGGIRLAFGAVVFHATHYVAALCGYAYAHFYPELPE